MLTPNLNSGGGGGVSFDGAGNLFIGGGGTVIVSANDNIAIGGESVDGATGQPALNLITTGVGNVCIGPSVGKVITSGSYNVAIGESSLIALTTGEVNVAVGDYALQLVTTGSRNIGIGELAGDGLTTGNDNIFLGLNSTTKADLSKGIAIGYNASVINDNQCVVGGTAADAVCLIWAGATAPADADLASSQGSLFWDFTNGSPALRVKGKTADGTVFSRRMEFDAAGNHFVGGGGGSVSSDVPGFEGLDNISIGTGSVEDGTDPALNSLTTGIANVAIGNSTLKALTAGEYNCCLGHSVAAAFVTGNDNVAIGSYSLSQVTATSANVAVGGNSGLSLLTGQENTFVGNSADTTKTNLERGIAIGYNAKVNNDNQCVIGGLTANAVCLGWAGVTAPADADIAAGQFFMYWDSTNGASKLKIKGKSANGTVVTGEVALA